MEGTRELKIGMDHCRIGSLESCFFHGYTECMDHCRIGSLEMACLDTGISHKDHCRIGSLENSPRYTTFSEVGSLPHRQLRKVIGGTDND